MTTLGRRLRARLRLMRHSPPLRMPSTLRALGILGMNERNGDYIGIYNDRRHYPLVDDKLKTKELALAAGIDLASGRTVDGVWFNNVLDAHPDSGNRVRGIQVPDWDELLTLAARSYDLTRLGYLGVDVVLDRDHGPLVLEYNARPGLNIQLANQMGLLSRLKQIRALAQVPDDAAARVALGQQLFGG